MKDRVTFRKFENDEVIALFPDIEWDTQGNITSYMHIGQHGGASKELLNDLLLAETNEYQELKEESETIGYYLVII